MLNEDYKDMLRALSDEKVSFLLVGAYALAVHGYPRATLDMDLWKSLLYRGLEHESDVQEHPDYLDEAYRTGRQLAEALNAETPITAGNP